MSTKILVVEDEPDLEFLISRKFRKRIRARELQFVFAGNGVEALKQLEANPDVYVVLSDIRMPEMDGLTLLTHLREQYPLLCTIMVSAYGDMKNIRTAMNRGAYDFLTKPIDFNDLEITLDKTIQYVQQVMDELAERKKVEKQLIQLKKAVENMQLGVTVTDLDGKIIYTNPAEAEMHGWQVDELLGKDVGVFAPHGLRRPMTLEEIKQLKGLVRESVNARKDGSTFPVWLMSEIVRDIDGEPTAIVTSCEDITERKRADEALRESEAKYRELVQNANSCIIRITPQGRITFFNEFAQSFFGYSEDDILGENVMRTISPDTDSASIDLVEMIEGIMRYPQRYMNNESEHVRRNGERVWMAWTNKAICDNTGRLVEILCVGNDITERKAMEEELRKHRDHLEELVKERTAELKQAKETAESANRAKSDFLANMSHELRTPLNGILGYTQILKRDSSLTDRQHDGINVIHRSGEHLLMMINDILDLSKIEARKMDLELVDFHLPDVLKMIVEIARIRAEQKGITFEYHAAPELPKGVRGDETRLRQILLNLLSNAVKFTIEGGVVFRVDVRNNHFSDVKSKSAKALTTNIRFEVKDTGIGIPPAHIEKIFSAFHQVGDKRIQAEGTGLGLAISQRLVRMMGGKLSVKSRVGQGSMFWFEIDLPVIDERLFESRVHHKRRNIVGFKGPSTDSRQTTYKILIVDDKETNRGVLKDMFEPLGFDIVEAVDGRDMLDKATTYHPDLILADLVMPVMDGLEAVRRLRNLPDLNDVVVIAISASVSEQKKQESLEAGFNEFLAKPFQVEDLLNLIRVYLKLDWIYEDGIRDEQRERFSLEPIIPPPQEELTDLYKIAMIGQITKLRKHVNNIEATDPKFIPFAARIRQFAKEFQIEEIQEFIQQYMKNEE